MEGYDYNPSTGTYVRNPHFRPSHPPPLPPKEYDSVKETQTAPAELEASLSSAGSFISVDSQQPKRRKVRVLSLDGGGIRGYSTLVILGELMHQVYVQENGGRAPRSPQDLPRPCDYFDLIGGNGTGGLIALMLGRMRMDVESCKSYYVSLTRFVFITDKTILGMPYGKTLFKASRLEEAIKHCVRESTRFDSEKIVPHSPPPAEPTSPQSLVHRRTDSWRRRRSESAGQSEERGRTGRPRRNVGNPDAPLYDTREGACKTFVTAMLEGSRKGAPPVLLRSYPSPAESMPSYRTTIWQAGRATCATAAAFKSVTIDHLTFLDEGNGMYNPAFQVLDEAHIHEFPDCDIAVFVSVGTGKRQKSNNTREEKRDWWEGVAFEGFAEAKRRLIRRIDDCERVHRELVDGDDGGRPKLAQGGVSTQDYYRFNVEVGVGEFGMNEWNRLSEVATGTRRYLTQRETSKLVKECAGKLVSRHPKNPKQQSPQVQQPQTQQPQVQPQVQQQPPPQIQSQQQQPPPQRRPSHPPPQHPPPQRPPQPPAQQQHAPHPQPQHPSQRPNANVKVAPQLQHIIMPDEKSYRQTPPVASNPYAPPPPPPPPQVPEQPLAPPPKPQKVGKVLVASKTPEPSGYYADDTPNPEIRLTSPSTVAGGSDDEEDMYKGYGRRRRRKSRSRSRSHSLGGIDE
ncbi:acyl transferase/acyl hydrolase/lysophospholipase [Tricharina praecox]|uniref:acyl transferase/acyl hydrolase/lysophospholipase n=1 Tax=Tricharina praecox TaxID=43433 RepID=UPI00221ECBE5|nr:acyl transferase/acyl hydrolase/lysophospholipase [Tricharina praecox]KAI5857787.1 acyl transferase/acyl hydrolase/lysophospholipase [Tricharina praecox]